MREQKDIGAARGFFALAKTTRLHQVGLAFFWACGLLTFRSSALLCACIDTVAFSTLVVLVGLSAQIIVLLTIATMASRRPEALSRLPGWLFVSVSMVGLLLLSSVGHVGPDMSRIASVVGSGCAGCGYGYLCGMWAQAYGHMHPSRTSFYIPIVFVLTIGIYLAVTGLSDSVGIQATLLMAPLPIVSYRCLKLSLCESDVSGDDTADERAYSAAFRSVWRLILGSVIIAFMFGFAWQLSVEAVGSVNETNYVPMIASLIAGAAFALLIVAGRKKVDLSLAYKVVVPFFVVAFVLLPVLWEQQPIGLYSVMTVGYGLFDVVIWCLVAETAYDNRISGFVLGGLVRGVALLARLIGTLVGYMYVLIPHRPPLIVVVISLAALYFVGMWAMTVARRRNPVLEQTALPVQMAAPADDAGEAAPLSEEKPVAGEGVPRSEKPPVAVDFEQRCDGVVARYHLTRREGEVLPYLAKGRSAKFIAEALFVSENTIRSHISRILEKTDLHSKQELIDLVDASGAEEIDR
ncbi:MAG: LuxR family transcriptional regulator [Raoultibacter sp.]